MTEMEEKALGIIKRKKIKGSSALAREMKITRQWAHVLVTSLIEKGYVKYIPARLIAED